MKNTETAKQESIKGYNINDIEPYRPRPASIPTIGAYGG